MSLMLMRQNLFTGAIFLSNTAKCEVFYMKMVRIFLTAYKGAGIFLHELQLYDSFRQKCSKLDTFTA
jgi:hypothetical protein